MKIKSKTGISLIVLLITILVIAILLTTVVLSMKDQHMTESAYEAVMREKIESYRIDIDDYVSKQELEQGLTYNKSLLNANTEGITYAGSTVEGNIFSILHSMTAEDSQIFQIENGKLVYLPDLASDNFSKEEFEISCRSGLISYVSNGLVGYYEATNNVGGAKKDDIISWKDLTINNNNAKISKGTKDAFENDAFKTDGSNISATFPIKLPNNSSFSIEVVYKNLDDSSKLFTLNNSYVLNSIGEKDKIYRTLFVYDNVSDTIKIYNLTNTLQDTMYSVGLKTSNLNSIEIPADSKKEYYSIRIYNKNILNESTRNQNIDIKRFEDIN